MPDKSNSDEPLKLDDISRAARPRRSLNLKNLLHTAAQNKTAEPTHVSVTSARQRIGPQLRAWTKAGWLDEDLIGLFETEEPELIAALLAEARKEEARARRKRKKTARSRNATPAAGSAIVQGRDARRQGLSPPSPKAVASDQTEADGATRKLTIVPTSKSGGPRRNPGID